MPEQYRIEHMADLVTIMKEQFPKDRLLSFQHYKTDAWLHISGRRVAEKCMDVAKGLAELGIAPGEPVGIYSPNRKEFIFTELGLFMLRGVSVPFYATCSPDQIAFIAKKTRLRFIFVGEQYQYNNAYQVQREKGLIERIIIFDPRVVKQFDDHSSIYYDEFIRIGDSARNETTVLKHRADCLPSDLALIIFTSGSTGTPKGVKVLHRAMAMQVNVHHFIYPSINRSDVSLNFLPLSHIFEKMWVYFCLTQGVRNAIVHDPKKVQEVLPQIKPTLMCNVPRYWEKVYQGVNKHIDQSLKLMQRIYADSLHTGRRYRLEYRNLGKKPPFFLELKYRFFSNTVFSILRRKLGLQRGRFFPTAGAKLSDEINIFLQSCGFPIIVGYGLSESCATVSSYPTSGYKIGSVGRISPIVDVRIDPENNEIQLRGETVSPGYFENEEATLEAFTPDGWFRTGDKGRIEGDVLYYEERIKDLFKTANGKYIAPQQIEAMLSAEPLIEQVAAIGDGYKFVSALIYPQWSQLQLIAIDRGWADEDTTIEELSGNQQVHLYMMSLIEGCQASLATFEKVKRIVLLTRPFSEAQGELTATLKLRRKVIYEHFQEQIEQIYAE